MVHHSPFVITATLCGNLGCESIMAGHPWAQHPTQPSPHLGGGVQIVTSLWQLRFSFDTQSMADPRGQNTVLLLHIFTNSHSHALKTQPPLCLPLPSLSQSSP